MSTRLQVNSLLIISFLLISNCAYQTVSVPTITGADFTAAYRQDLAALASDEFEGRYPGSPGGKKTTDYLVERFKAIGLEPGNNGSYYQEIPLKSVHIPSTTNTVVSSPAGTVDLVPLNNFIPSLRGSESNLNLSDRDLVFVGYGAVVPELGWDDYADINVEGKVVLMLRNHPGYLSDDSTFSAAMDTSGAAFLDTKYDTARKHGAVGYIVIVDTAMNTNKLPWKERVTAAARGTVSLDDNQVDTTTTMLDGLVDVDLGKQLLTLAGFDYDSLLVAATKRGFKAFDLGLKLNANYTDDVRTFTSPNVMGLLLGSKRPDEVLIYTAHWDHDGRLNGLEGDQIFNGAADNGTGTAGIINLASAFASLPERPDRSIMFIGFTAEELGSFGSRYYAEHPAYHLGNTVGVINIDMLNFIGLTHDLIVYGMGKSKLDDYAEHAAEKYGMHVRADLWPDENIYFRSDHINLARKGVPAMFLDTGIDSREHGEEWGMEYYQNSQDNYYHKVTDEYSDTLNVDGIIQYLQITFDIGYTLANSKKFPNWYKDDEFRPIRDESRKAAKQLPTAP
jgi:hypothetical protein